MHSLFRRGKKNLLVGQNVNKREIHTRARPFVGLKGRLSTYIAKRRVFLAGFAQESQHSLVQPLCTVIHCKCNKLQIGSERERERQRETQREG